MTAEALKAAGPLPHSPGTSAERLHAPRSCLGPTQLTVNGSPRCRAQEEAEFREYASRPNVIDLIQKRIAPQIFGAERIKEAVACLLFGGSRKVPFPAIQSGQGPPVIFAA